MLLPARWTRRHRPQPRSGASALAIAPALSRSVLADQVKPDADLSWAADLHPPILAELLRREPDAVVEALRRHFDEVGEDMAGRMADDEPTAEVATIPRRKPSS
jgi:DNA-binding GntR family transcriptional regulator